MVIGVMHALTQLSFHSEIEPLKIISRKLRRNSVTFTSKASTYANHTLSVNGKIEFVEDWR